jgi:HPt (histidine-containing phosphotransfer) domain-containing protein
MTASSFAEDREACRAAGMRDFVGKPFDLAHVATMLSRTSEGEAPNGGSIARYGEPRFFDDLFRLFVAETHRRLARMTDALRRGDAAEIEGQAHVLKSASATVGATGMSELCAFIEGVAHEGILTSVAGWIDMLSAELEEVERISRRGTRRTLSTLDSPGMTGASSFSRERALRP